MPSSLACNYPADYEKCLQHRLANRIFKGRYNESTQICDCCGRKVGQTNPQISCCYNAMDKLKRLGPGVPILFIFIQNGIMLFLSLIAIFSAYALASNIVGKSCLQQEKCINNIFNQMSIVNKVNDPSSMIAQSFLVMTFTILYIAILQYFIYRIRVTEQECDKEINSPSDYSIIVRGLPQKCRRSEIHEMINQQRQWISISQKQDTDNLSIYDVEMSYSLNEYLKEVEEEKARYVQAIKDGEQYTYQILKIPNPQASKLTSSFAIVVFNKQSSKQLFPSDPNLLTQFCNCLFNKSSSQGLYTVREKEVSITRAPEPDDIIWQNSDITRFEIIRNKTITHIIGVLILVAGGVVQYYLQYYSLRIDNPSIIFIFSFISSISMTIINIIIVIVLLVVTKYQGNWTKTQLNASILNKICLFSFFNSGIFYPAATILATEIQNFNFSGDFTFQIMLFMIINSLSPTFLKILFTKIQFPTFIARCLFRLNCLSYTQEEANTLFEMPQPSFPEQYAYVIKTIWLTCFYAPLVPIVVPISIAGLAFYYFSEVYLFRTAYSKPNMLSINIAHQSIFLLNFTPLVISLGQIAIVYYIKYFFKSSFTVLQQIPLFLSLAFSVFVIFVPSIKINQKIKTFQSTSRIQSYQKVSEEFEIQYKTSNPVTLPGTHKLRSEIRWLRQLEAPNEQELQAIHKMENILQMTLLDNQDL